MGPGTVQFKVGDMVKVGDILGKTNLARFRRRMGCVRPVVDGIPSFKSEIDFALLSSGLGQMFIFIKVASYVPPLSISIRLRGPSQTADRAVHLQWCRTNAQTLQN
jgi:hypothetical protein